MNMLPDTAGGNRMPVPEISKAKMSGTERDFRSRLVQLMSSTGLLRGTLTVREKVCGKPTCKCVRGEKHVGLYLVSSKDGKVRQLFVPRSHEDKVRKWLEQYKRAEDLLEDLSDLHWAKIQNREE
jgi:hypothetical protein